MLEILLKIILSLLISSAAIVFLIWIWNHQIDTIETFKGYFREKSKETVGWIATRDENKIYQEGSEVGKIIGEIKKIDGNYLFPEIHNSLALDSSKNFNYRRHIYRIIQIEVIAQTAATELGMVNGYKKNVLCERLEESE